MEFLRPELDRSVASLTRSGDVEDRCIGCNYVNEENVEPVRQRDVERMEPGSTDVREVVKSYYDISVEGMVRGHRPSTFDERVNAAALLPATVEPVQKVIRLERIDGLLSMDPDLTFDRLVDARRDNDAAVLDAFVSLFRRFPGERPAFAAFKSEVEGDLTASDWLDRLIDRIGLYHHYPFSGARPYTFALMEYLAEDVFAQAAAKGIDRPFAVATVLECRNNPAFFPVPRGCRHGFTVDLRQTDPPRPSVREILHMRLDYRWTHVARFARWSGRGKPDIEESRARHLAMLRRATGRSDFGDCPV